MSAASKVTQDPDNIPFDESYKDSRRKLKHLAETARNVEMSWMPKLELGKHQTPKELKELENARKKNRGWVSGRG